jgi:Zn-dependent protease
MPVGQLDGGHVAYAILRRRCSLSRFVQAMGLVLLWYSPLWLAWMVVMLVIGKRHPPTLADIAPSVGGRILVGIVGLWCSRSASPRSRS